MADSEDDGIEWKIPRRVPLTVLLMLLAQMAGILITGDTT